MEEGLEPPLPPRPGQSGPDNSNSGSCHNADASRGNNEGAKDAKILGRAASSGDDARSIHSSAAASHYSVASGGGGMSKSSMDNEYGEHDDDGMPDFAKFLDMENEAAESEIRQEEFAKEQQRELAKSVLEMMDFETEQVVLPENTARRLCFQGGFVRGAVVHKGVHTSQQEPSPTHTSSSSADSRNRRRSSSSAEKPKHAQSEGSGKVQKKGFLSSTRDYFKRKGISVTKALAKSNSEGEGTPESLLTQAKSVRDFVEAISSGKIKDDPALMLQAFIFDDYLVLTRMRNATGRLVAIASFELLDVSVRDMGSGHFVFEDEILQDAYRSDEDDDEDVDEAANEEDSKSSGHMDSGSEARLSRHQDSETAHSAAAGSTSGQDHARLGSFLDGKDVDEDEGIERKFSRRSQQSVPTKHSSSPDFVMVSMLEVMCKATKDRIVLDAGDESHKLLWIEQIVMSVKDAIKSERPIRAAARGWEHTIRRGTMWSAALEGHSYEVGRILAKWPERASIADDNGMSPLHLACLGGQTLTAAQLLRAGALPSDVDNDLMTPLHYAALGHRVMTASMLLNDDDNGHVDVDAQDLQSRTPLMVACSEPALDLSEAAAFIEEVGGFGPETEVEDVNGQTALMIAVRRNQGGLVASLLKIGAKTETISSRTGLTALLMICGSTEPNLGILGKLLMQGANPNVRQSDEHRCTGLRLLCKTLMNPHANANINDCRDCVHMLVSYGARLDLDDVALALHEVDLDASEALAYWSSRSEPSGMANIAPKQAHRVPFAVSSNDFIDSSTCSACEFAFGMLDKRQHCRRCARSFCVHCTTKNATMRSTDNQTMGPVRVCDACFNFLCRSYTVLVQDLRTLESTSTKSTSVNHAKALPGSSTSAAPKSLTSSSQRQLPADRMAPVAQRRSSNPNDRARGIQTTLGQTRDALLERGERLSRLGEASTALSNNAGNFSDMARRLREREEKNNKWFGGLF